MSIRARAQYAGPSCISPVQRLCTACSGAGGLRHRNRRAYCFVVDTHGTEFNSRRHCSDRTLTRVRSMTAGDHRYSQSAATDLLPHCRLWAVRQDRPCAPLGNEIVRRIQEDVETRARGLFLLCICAAPCSPLRLSC